MGELTRARRHDHPLSVIVNDVDHFKPANDTHGHAAGDDVLRQIARACTPLRDVDTPGRYGGEDSVAVLPHTELEVVAERSVDG